MASNFPAAVVPNIYIGEEPPFKVEFPLSPNLQFILIGAELYQNADEHERLVLHFKGNPFVDGTTLASEDPVKFTYGDNGIFSTFYGYVHTLPQINGPRENKTEVICLGATHVMKETYQKIYKNMTADAVVTKIAAKHGFKPVTQRHPRVRQSVAQAGQSDWELLRSLAKQTGYALIPEGTSITFMSKDKIYADKKSTAPYYNYINSPQTGVTPKTMRIYGNIINFDPSITDYAPDRDVRVDRVISGRHFTSGSLISNKYQYKSILTNTLGTVIPGEIYFE